MIALGLETAARGAATIRANGLIIRTRFRQRAIAPAMRRVKRRFSNFGLVLAGNYRKEHGFTPKMLAEEVGDHIRP
jgi:hypothetical protein